MQVSLSLILTLSLGLKICSSSGPKYEVTCFEACSLSTEVHPDPKTKSTDFSQDVACSRKCHVTKENATISVNDVMNGVESGEMPEDDMKMYRKCLESVGDIESNKDMVVLLKCFSSNSVKMV